MGGGEAKAWAGCPIRFGMGIFGDKWTLLIVRDLMFKGKRYYSEFTDPIEGIATNILADRLRKLVKNQIVSKRRDAKHRSKFIYELTPRGLDLLPMMLEIVDWSETYDGDTKVPQAFIKELRKDRRKFEKKLRRKLESEK